MTNRALELSWDIPGRGETIAGKYVVEAPCGRGGLAVVLSAMHLGLDRRVAIKVLLPEWAGDEEVVRRFVREGRTATRIKSEHVVRVFDVGTLEGGAPYLVLEYLEGHNLEEVVTNWGPVSVSTAVDWVLQAAEAIAEAHTHGIVHRDIKPANLFLTRRADGSACIKVIDFGLSKLTDPRLLDVSRITLPTDVMGSPHYMAPEQLRAACNADGRADLWALGTVLHELITGQPPFTGQTFAEICASVLTQATPPISSIRANVPPGLERAILRSLEKDPDARFTTVAEMAYAIAPFGTALAAGSYERIARMAGPPALPSLPGPPSGLANEVTLPSLPSLHPEDRGPTFSSWPSDPDAARFERRVFRGDASARVVLGSLLMLAGVGAGVFMFMYTSVHGDEPRLTGVTAMQAPGTAGAGHADPNGPAPPAAAAAPEGVPAAVPASPSASTVSTPPGATASAPPGALTPLPASAPLIAIAAPAPVAVAAPVAVTPAPAAVAPVTTPGAPARSRVHIAPAAPAMRPSDRAGAPRPSGPLKAHDNAQAPAARAVVPAPHAPPAAEPSDPPSDDSPPPKPPPSGDDLFDGRQ
jgi:serine/threonine protein kinase